MVLFDRDVKRERRDAKPLSRGRFLRINFRKVLGPTVGAPVAMRLMLFAQIVLWT